MRHKLTMYEMHVGNGSDRGKIWSTCHKPGHGMFGIGEKCPKCQEKLVEQAQIKL